MSDKSPTGKGTKPANPANTDQTTEQLKKRRRVVKRILAGGGIAAGSGALSQGWDKPVIKSIMLPAHAAGSPGITTTPASTTAAVTTPASTTF